MFLDLPRVDFSSKDQTNPPFRYTFTRPLDESALHFEVKLKGKSTTMYHPAHPSEARQELLEGADPSERRRVSQWLVRESEHHRGGRAQEHEVEKGAA